jgi:hypothetical protein
MSANALAETAKPDSRIWLIAIPAGIGLVLSLIAYLTPHGAVAHSWGAVLVVVATALLLVASLLLALAEMPHWFVVLLEVLIILDIVGTGVAAYFLETYILLAFMVIALIGWIFHLASASSRTPGS